MNEYKPKTPESRLDKIDKAQLDGMLQRFHGDLQVLIEAICEAYSVVLHFNKEQIAIIRGEGESDSKQSESTGDKHSAAGQGDGCPECSVS